MPRLAHAEQVALGYAIPGHVVLVVNALTVAILVPSTTIKKTRRHGIRGATGGRQWAGGERRNAPVHTVPSPMYPALQPPQVGPPKHSARTSQVLPGQAVSGNGMGKPPLELSAGRTTCAVGRRGQVD